MSKKFVVMPLHCTPSRLRFARNLAKRVVESMQVSSQAPTAENQVAAWSEAIEASAAYSTATPPVFFDRFGGGHLELRTRSGEPDEAAADAVMAAVAMVDGTNHFGCKVQPRGAAHLPPRDRAGRSPGARPAALGG